MTWNEATWLAYCNEFGPAVFMCYTIWLLVWLRKYERQVLLAEAGESREER